MSGERETREVHSGEFPALPRTWVDEVIVELRLRDVAGARIMEILAEVQTHCIEAGESPVEAFGVPRAYAASLDFEGQQRSPGAGFGRYVMAGAALLLGFLLAMLHMDDLVGGGQVRIDAGNLTSLLIVMVAFSTVGLWLRSVVERPLAVGLPAFVAGFAAYIALQIWGGPPLATVPAVGVAVVAGALGLGGALALTYLTLREPQDLLTPPGAAVRRDRGAGATQLAAIWFLPALALVMAAIAWLTR